MWGVQNRMPEQRGEGGRLGTLQVDLSFPTLLHPRSKYPPPLFFKSQPPYLSSLRSPPFHMSPPCSFASGFAVVCDAESDDKEVE